MVRVSQITLVLAAVLLCSFAAMSSAAEDSRKKPVPTRHHHTKAYIRKHTKPTVHHKKKATPVMKPTRKPTPKPVKAAPVPVPVVVMTPSPPPPSPAPPPPPFTASSDYTSSFPFATVTFTGVNIGVLKPSDDSESALDTIDFLNANAGPFSPSTNNASVGDTHAAFGFRKNALKFFGTFGINTAAAKFPPDLTGTVTGPGYTMDPFMLANDSNTHATAFTTFLYDPMSPSYPLSSALVYGTTYTMAGFRLTIVDNSLTGTSKAAYTNATYIGGPLVAGSQMTYTVDTISNVPTSLLNGDSTPYIVTFLSTSVLPIFTPISSVMGNPVQGLSFASTDVAAAFDASSTDSTYYGTGSKVLSSFSYPSATMPGMFDIAYSGTVTFPQTTNGAGTAVAPTVAPVSSPPPAVSSPPPAVSSPPPAVSSPPPVGIVGR